MAKRGSFNPLAGSDSQKRYYEDMYVKPLVTAGVGTAVAKMTLFADDNYVTVWGNKVPLWAASFVGLYVAGLAGEFLSNNVLPYSSMSPSGSITSGIIQPTAVGAANTAIWSLASSQGAAEKGNGSLFIMGAGAEVAGSYLYEHFVAPLLS